MQKLRFAIIGLVHGASYISSASRHPRTQLAALVDTDATHLKTLTAQHGVAGYDSVDALLAARVADVVIIATPTRFHAPMSAQCLDAGLHVMQCKPLCRNDEEAGIIGDAVKRNKGVFQVGYEFRSSPLHTSIMEHIRRGDLGEVTNVWYNEHCDQSENFGTWREA